jgi:hypothetical protein
MVTATEITRLTALEARVEELAKAVERMGRRIRIGRELAALAKVAPDLLAMRAHMEQIAEVAKVTPTLIGIATTGQDEIIFRKVLRQKFGWLTGSWMIRTVVVAGIGAVATVVAERVGGFHP